MFRYYLFAIVLKLFSWNSLTTRSYRGLALAKRKYLPSKDAIAPKYFFRTEKLFSLMRDHRVLRDGMSVFELGTGWIHWEATMLRNQIDCDALLYDVVDGRDLEKYRRVLARLAEPEVRRRLDLGNEAMATVMRELSAAADFQTIYDRLGFAYKLDPEGQVRGVEDGRFDLVISSDVFEHLPHTDIPQILRRLAEILKPGGWAYHQIVLADHLRIYANGVHPKQYLAYDDAHWKRYLSNGVQYINRVQLPEWRRRLDESGLRIVEERKIESADLNSLRIHPQFAGIPHSDLACTIVQFLLRKPAATGD